MSGGLMSYNPGNTDEARFCIQKLYCWLKESFIMVFNT